MIAWPPSVNHESLFFGVPLSGRCEPGMVFRPAIPTSVASPNQVKSRHCNEKLRESLRKRERSSEKLSFFLAEKMLILI
jgi:hypothetical protein